MGRQSALLLGFSTHRVEAGPQSGPVEVELATKTSRAQLYHKDTRGGTSIELYPRRGEPTDRTRCTAPHGVRLSVFRRYSRGRTGYADRRHPSEITLEFNWKCHASENDSGRKRSPGSSLKTTKLQRDGFTVSPCRQLRFVS